MREIVVYKLILEFNKMYRMFGINILTREC